jgi:23S rRNA-/tRNA-specific pseudouridylate synthase
MRRVQVHPRRFPRAWAADWKVRAALGTHTDQWLEPAWALQSETPHRNKYSGACAQERIVEEGDEWVVIDKPAGVPVPPTVDNVKENCLARVTAALGPACAPLRITHRLVRTPPLTVLSTAPPGYTRASGALSSANTRGWERV